MHLWPGPAYPSRMNGLTLVIGSKNGSSWSLRPWLLMKQAGLPFEEILVPLRRPDTARRIRTYSPSGKVPVLLAGHQRIWDSLAIAEFLAEQNPKLWPEDPQARAFARSICAEMHSGFAALRTFLPMDFTARFGPPGMLLSPVGADIDRVLEIWAECRERHCRPGPFLFGSFTIADAMFAPVCSRFTTYAIPLDPQSRTYVAYMMALPAMQEWGRGATAEVARSAAEAPPAAEEFWDDEPATPPPKVALAVPEVKIEPAPAPKTVVEAPRPVPVPLETAPMRPLEPPAPKPVVARPEEPEHTENGRRGAAAGAGAAGDGADATAGTARAQARGRPARAAADPDRAAARCATTTAAAGGDASGAAADQGRAAARRAGAAIHAATLRRAGPGRIAPRTAADSIDHHGQAHR